MVSLSERHGLFVETIWNHPENAELKRKRKDMNVLAPGDVLFIPDKRLKEEQAATGRRHVYRRKGVPALFRLQVFDGQEPRKRQRYKLTVDGRSSEGTTDDKGILIEFVATGASRGELVIGPDELRVQIDFGHMDPIDTLSGTQKRLANLGYDCGGTDGRPSEATEAAIRAFQRRFRLPETGEPDEATLRKLEEVHDAPNEFPEATASAGS
ncbi:peptidoglycan-binding domain-containing protein [Sorangium sp. So ce590]|uniref:peptidoglycan-binding domain-containing protein n=1 Tax=unclassified Sorangium TaxID=2621164 RepID=UPI003F640DB0